MNVDMWEVYIVRCQKDDTLYTGITNSLCKRLAAHNAGTGAKYTRGRGPIVLMISFHCEDKSSALKLEYKIKQLSRAKKLELCNEASISTKPNPQ